MKFTNQLFNTWKGMASLLNKFIFLLSFLFLSTYLNAQTHTFPVDAGPYVVTAGTPTQVCFNDAGNSAGAPAGFYNIFPFQQIGQPEEVILGHLRPMLQ